MCVDFFIVGEPKSGTTALASFLADHPEVVMSDPKELGFFATDLIKESDLYHGNKRYPHIRTIDEYTKYFNGEGRIKGEASTNYLYSKEAAKKIKNHNPNAKIIMMFRNPVDMIHSLHMQYVNEGREDELDFELALQKQEQRLNGQAIPANTVAPSYLQYDKWAQYAQQAERYLKVFPKKQILILISEEFSADNPGIFIKVCEFLNIDESFTPNFKIVHGSVKPRSNKMNHVLNNQYFKSTLMKIVGRKTYHSIRKPIVKLIMKPQPRSALDSETRAKLYGSHKANIEKFSKLINRDLSKIWRH